MSRRKDGRPRSLALPQPDAAASRRGRAAGPGSAVFGDSRLPVPQGPRTDEFLLRPITAADAARDHAAIMETRSDLRLWEQSAWPEDDFTVEANREDLAGLERRHSEHRAFTFTVLDPDGDECLGCVYVFPTSATFLSRAAVTPVADDAVWEEVDAVVYFWIRGSRVPSGLESRLLEALRTWMDEWAFDTAVFVTNEQFERQVALLEATDLDPRFELREPDKPGTYLVYG